MRALLLPAILLLGAINSALSAEESCVGRCLEGFNAKSKCQCDDLCNYYQSCCIDFSTVCKNKDTRGDVFFVPEDEQESDLLTQVTTPVENFTETTPVIERPTEETVEDVAVPDDTPEELCSGKPFDAFTNFKNGSMYAFRGKYFYELDDNKALDGYPKLIKDVWGIEGPIDAAFTRINCQGKTYMFKGTQYWRFSDGVLDLEYPRDIKVGFSNIPSDIDAAFTLPANNYQGQERAYFFKGRQYWQYEFTHQPSRQECLGSSPSELFTRYAVLQDDSWEDIFRLLVGDWFTGSSAGPRSIFRDWRGVPNGVDAVLPSRIYVPQQKQSVLRRSKRRKSKRRKSRRRRPSRIDPFQHEITEDFFSYDDYEDDPDWLPPDSQPKCQPVQSVFFFKNDKYYRVNLRTKRVDVTYPRYPRSIAEYWLGCKTSATQKKSSS
ncbi:PREDICTED: vitronectin [Nanorana parkeri]|uniref:vitronectin n=1 Tax=Nanorana parkeri TaxID=125878 RepID=UPI00085496E4|nr:PREDICTED: vitronectin [Nanorana parkeri]